MPVYSHSRIGTYGQCPRKYKFRYIEKPEIEVPRTVEQYLGDRVHKALEKCYRLAHMHRVIKLEELMALFGRLWKEEFPENLKIVREELTADDYFNMGRQCLRMYHARYYPFDQEMTLGLEKLINFMLDREGRYRMQGYIDRVSRDSSGRIRIHDYKTGNTLPTRQEIESDTQLALYQIAVQDMWPDNSGIELVWHYLKFDASLVSHRTDEQLENLKKDYIDRIREIEKAIEINQFPTEESQLCDWCEYHDLCPAKGGRRPGDEEQQELRVCTPEEIAVLVDRYIELDKEKKGIGAKIDDVKAKLIALGDPGTTRLLEGTGDNAVAVTLDRETKLPTKSADTEAFRLIAELVTGAGLYDEYSKLDIGAVQKALQKGLLPEALDAALKKYQKVHTRESVRIKRSGR